MQLNPTGRVVVIGVGMVGSSIAYAILNQEIAKQIVIIDIAEDLAKGHVLDMQDASQFTNGTKVQHGNYSDMQDGDVVVITCGVAQKEDQTRQDLIKINAGVIRDVIKNIRETKKQVYIVMVTNPVDIMTYIAVTESGLPGHMVFGSGTYLDTGRLRLAIGNKVKANAHSIHAYILGEHGDTSFALLSNSSVAGIGINKLISVDEALYEELIQAVRGKAYEIIKRKKATYFGIGNAVAVIVRSIIRDEEVVIPVSVMLNDNYGQNDLCIGVPAKVSSRGAEIIGEVSFNQIEQSLFIKSANYLKEQLQLVK